MRSLAGFVCAIAIVSGCGGGEEPPAPKSTPKQGAGPGANLGAQAQNEKPPPPKPDTTELENRLKTLLARERELDRELGGILADQEKERAGLPKTSELREIRRKFSQLRRDATQSALKLARSQKRLEELKRFAESAAAGELKELEKQREAIQARYNEAFAGWKTALAESRMGVVEESPVKKSLDAVRAVKQQWFVATSDARRGTVNSSAKKAINDSFRSWLGEKPIRKEVCGLVIAQPGAPKGKTPDTYDFTNLEFYVLLELLENELDKQNIAVEKKELKQNEAKVDKIVAELDAIDLKINEAMQKGGPELEEYLDLKERIGGTEALDRRIQAQYQVYGDMMEQATTMKERHAEERKETEDKLAAVRKEVAALKRKLAR